VQALIARADVVLTTRLHGLVLALAQGVPAVAVDPICGGAKVLAQARVLDWPACLTVDALEDAALKRDFEWCLTLEARQRAQASVAAGREKAAEINAALGRYLRRR
jgi:polysaccharide pyruvyl transferase WcaK-like protein